MLALFMIGLILITIYLVKTAADYFYVLSILKKKQKYDPMDFLYETRLGVYLARRKYSRTLREKQRLETTNKDKLNY